VKRRNPVARTDTAGIGTRFLVKERSKALMVKNSIIYSVVQGLHKAAFLARRKSCFG
jgi:hypothetical protein